MNPSTTTTAGAIPVRLDPHRNSAAFWAAGTVPEEGFDGFGRAFPAEELGSFAEQLDLPSGWGHGTPDNIACEGQLLTLELPVSALGLELVGAGSGGTVAETLRLLPAGTGDGPALDVRVELSDFLSRRPAFQDSCAATASFLYDIGGRAEYSVKPRLWRSRVEFAAPVACGRIVLPVNPDLHLVGLWLLPAPTRAGRSRR